MAQAPRNETIYMRVDEQTKGQLEEVSEMLGKSQNEVAYECLRAMLPRVANVIRHRHGAHVGSPWWVGAAFAQEETMT